MIPHQSPPILDLQSVSLHAGHLDFGPFALQIKHGEHIAVLGPSGAGKSTLLKLLSKEQRPLQGHILFQHKNLAQWSLADLSQSRAVLPQSYEVAFDFPVELIISLGRVSHPRDPLKHQIVAEAAHLAQCDHLMDRQFDMLSGGEKARVQLARVFAQLWDKQNGLLLIDEPIAALDPGLQSELLDSIADYARERQHTVITVLHDINHALSHFERLLMIRQGQLIGDHAADRDAIPYLEQLYNISLETLTSPSGEFFVRPVRKRPHAS